MTCESGCDSLPGKIQFLSGSGRVGNDWLGMSMGSVRGGSVPPQLRRGKWDVSGSPGGDGKCIGGGSCRGQIIQIVSALELPSSWVSL